MGLKRTELIDGCFARAMDDEPMFVLLARDLRAPEAVRRWAVQRKADITLGLKPESDMAMVTEAFETADNMEAWRSEHDGKWRTGLFAPRAPQPMGETRDEQVRRGMLGPNS